MTNDPMDFTGDAWSGRLSEYLDGELEGAGLREMEEHLRSCLTCRRTLDQLRAVQAKAASLADVAPGPQVWAAVAERIGAPGLRLEDTDDELAARRRLRLVPRRTAWLRVGTAAAAVLAVGITIGRGTLPRAPGRLPADTVTAPAKGTPMTADAYRVAVSEHLDHSEALLTSFRAEAASGRVDPQVKEWAGQTLTSTRLLLDSPAAQDPRLRGLLQDLELVLAQIAALPTQPQPNQTTNEVDLARRAVDESHVLPRIRTLDRPGSPITHGET